MAIPASKVLVTGASGFIALHCIDRLLQSGFEVCGTLRTPEREAEVRTALDKALGDASERISFAQCDLTEDDGWEQAAAGCQYVLHVASPFPPGPPAQEDDLIGPARDGTLRVLRAASQAGVKRVVVTSSTAAIAAGRSKPNQHVFNEGDWTDLDDPTVGAYEKSKTIAEQAAWEFVRSHDSPELAVINPGAVLGPLLGPDHSTSGDIVRLMMQGNLPACPRVGFNMVDVRDVADAHIAAMTIPEAAGQRFLCCLDHVWMLDVAKMLESQFAAEGWRLPRKQIPTPIVRLGALFSPTLKRAAQNLGRERRVDNSRIRSVLHWSPRSEAETVVSMARSMIELGVLTS